MKSARSNRLAYAITFLIILMMILLAGCKKAEDPKEELAPVTNSVQSTTVTPTPTPDPTPTPKPGSRAQTGRRLVEPATPEENLNGLDPTKQRTRQDFGNDGHDGNGIRIYLDPGHGGDAACLTEYDGQQYERGRAGAATGDFPANSLGTSVGTTGGGRTECDVIYDLALMVQDALTEEGYDVTLSRDDVHPASAGGGTAPGNWERGRLAATYDLWIVLHADGGGGQGFHCVSYDCDRSFRNDIGDAFIRAIEAYNRPIHTTSGYNHGYSGNDAGILQAPKKYLECGGDLNNMIYLEAGFMDNSEDLQFLLSEEGQNIIAKCITDAVNTWKDGADEQ
ncbi:MAG: N-acetylmuramoyl-L-alanine amidase [Lachnospiraceae bacterium]|nr:N-acetylmuramoyl-L-alanine amidase [Lachnospiraceae bacterium]